MGTCYYGVCHDCKQFIDLDKFYGWNPGHRSVADIDKEDLSQFNGGWVYRSMRLHYFIGEHNGHRLGVLTEHELEKDGWKEAAPWPRPSESVVDTIDFTDPKAGRLVIKTRLGELYIDVRKDDVNCFRFPDGGQRVDTVLLSRKELG